MDKKAESRPAERLVECVCGLVARTACDEYFCPRCHVHVKPENCVCCADAKKVRAR